MNGNHAQHEDLPTHHSLDIQEGAMVLVALHYRNEEERKEAVEDLTALELVHHEHEDNPPKLEGRLRGYHGFYLHAEGEAEANDLAMQVAEALDEKGATGVCQIHVASGGFVGQASFGEAQEVAERHHDWCLLCVMPSDKEDDLEDVWELMNDA